MINFIVFDLIAPLVLNFFIQKNLGDSYNNTKAYIIPVLIIVAVFAFYIGYFLYNFFFINKVPYKLPRNAVHIMTYAIIWIALFYWVFVLILNVMLPSDTMEKLTQKSKGFDAIKDITKGMIESYRNLRDDAFYTSFIDGLKDKKGKEKTDAINAFKENNDDKSFTNRILNFKTTCESVEKALKDTLKEKPYSEKKHVRLVSNMDNVIKSFEKRLVDPLSKIAPLNQYNLESYIITYTCVVLFAVRFLTRRLKKLRSIVLTTIGISLVLVTLLCTKWMNKSLIPLKFVIVVPFLLAPLYAWMTTMIYARLKEDVDEKHVFSETYTIYMLVLTCTMYCSNMFDFEFPCTILMLAVLVIGGFYFAIKIS